MNFLEVLVRIICLFVLGAGFIAAGSLGGIKFGNWLYDQQLKRRNRRTTKQHLLNYAEYDAQLSRNIFKNVEEARRDFQ